MTDVSNITLGQIVAFFAVLAALIGGFKLILDPMRKFVKRVEGIEEQQKTDTKRVDHLETDTKMILTCLNALILHAEDNNHTNELEKTKVELSKYLINR